MRLGACRAADMSLPRVLQIRPTTSCPARCATCTTLVKRDAPDLALDDIQANLDYFIEEHGVDELVFSGAEITLRADFREILERVRQKRFRLVTLISSGLAWTEELARACAGVIDRVVIALTPPSAMDWRSLRGRSAKARDGILLLKKARVRVQSNTVIQSSSLEVLDEIAESIERLDVEQPIFLFPFGTGGARAVKLAGVPEWSTVRAPLTRVLEALERRRPRLKNVPPCVLGPLSRFASRTTARILVERARELEHHALIPPFVGMTYAPDCARCSLEPDCDGYWPALVEAGVLPAPAPRFSFVAIGESSNQ